MGGHVHEGSRRAVLAAFWANLGVAVAKICGFLFTGAASLLAEALHSLADTGNQLLLLLGAARAQRPPTPAHPFGYGRERYFWAFVVAVILFTMGSLFAIVNGIGALREPHEIEHAGWAVGILVVAIGLEASSFRTAVRSANQVREGKSWWEFIRRAKMPELPVVLLEDLGALLGLVIALVAVALALWTGNPVYDAVGSLAIGLLLGVIAFVLGAEMKSLLIGESASARMEVAIREAMESHPRLLRLVHLRTQHLGPDELLVAARVEMDPGLSLPEAARVIDEAQELVRARAPSARQIYIEPQLAQTRQIS